MSKIWFTSDHHFGHGRIVGYCNRPWWRLAHPEDRCNRHLMKVVPNTQLMENDLVQRWNSRVAEEDTVYHLGDFAWWKLPPEEVVRIRQRLNGKIKLLVGNHDVDRMTRAMLPSTCELFFEAGDGNSAALSAVIQLDGKTIALAHHGPHSSPHRDMTGLLEHTDLLLHGHSHAHRGIIVRQTNRGDGKMIPTVDMSVEGWDYAPASLDEILEKIK